VLKSLILLIEPARTTVHLVQHYLPGERPIHLCISECKCDVKKGPIDFKVFGAAAVPDENQCGQIILNLSAEVNLGKQRATRELLPLASHTAKLSKYYEPNGALVVARTYHLLAQRVTATPLEKIVSFDRTYTIRLVLCLDRTIEGSTDGSIDVFCWTTDNAIWR